MRKFVATLVLAALPALAADLTSIQVHVVNSAGHPIEQASVIVKFVDGRSKVKFGAKIRQEWDLKTNQEGVAIVPAIPQGKIQVQIIAKGLQTFGQIFDIAEEEKTVEIKLNDPQAQHSVHQ